MRDMCGPSALGRGGETLTSVDFSAQGHPDRREVAVLFVEAVSPMAVAVLFFLLDTTRGAVVGRQPHHAAGALSRNALSALFVRLQVSLSSLTLHAQPSRRVVSRAVCGTGPWGGCLRVPSHLSFPRVCVWGRWRNPAALPFV